MTPAYKQSGNPETQGLISLAADGEAMAWRSVGNFGGEGSQAGGHYLSRRGPTGWATANVIIPAKIAPGTVSAFVNKAEGYSSDLSRVFFCGLVGESAGVTLYGTPNPYICALRDSSGAWAASPALTAVNAYSNTPTGQELEVGASADLSHFVFFSKARYLINDTATGLTYSMYEWVDPTGPEPQLRLVNVDSGGAIIGPSSTPSLGGGLSGAARAYQAISADGSTIYFTATPSGGVATIYARKDGATTTAVSNPSPAECTTCDPTAKPATYIGASSDGERVWFTTAQQLVNADTDTTADLYEYDFEASAGHHLIQVSGGGPGDLTPGAGANVQGVLRTSEDGTHACFVAKGVLTTVPNGRGAVAVTGESNLYCFERDAQFPLGSTRFVAVIPSGEVSGLTPASEAPEKGNSQLTPDGRFLVFQTAAQLIGSGPEADTDSADDVYRFDMASGELVRISVGEPGYPASGNGNTAGMRATVMSPRKGGWVGSERRGTTAISADGSYVVFETPERLQADDVDGGTTASECNVFANPPPPRTGCDVYIWHDGVVRMISDGQPVATTQETSAWQGGWLSDSGRDVFFTSAQQLVPQDRDENVDIYDARVGGGFDYTPPPAACVDNPSCHGAAPGGPEASAAASATFSGPGNVTASKPKRPKKHAGKHMHHRRHAKHAQRTQTSTHKHG